MPPAADEYPPEISDHLHRRIWRSSIQELRQHLERVGPVFAKPRVDRKRFTGRVFTHADDWPLMTLPSTLDLWCAEPVTWRSEFRIFVADDAVVGSRPYDGDAAVEPDPDTVAECVDALRNRLAGYALDVGVLDNGATAVVEVNEGFGIGTYGLAPEPTARVLISRWRQLVPIEYEIRHAKTVARDQAS